MEVLDEDTWIIVWSWRKSVALAAVSLSATVLTAIYASIRLSETATPSRKKNTCLRYEFVHVSVAVPSSDLKASYHAVPS